MAIFHTQRGLNFCLDYGITRRTGGQCRVVGRAGDGECFVITGVIGTWVGACYSLLCCFVVADSLFGAIGRERLELDFYCALTRAVRKDHAAIRCGGLINAVGQRQGRSEERRVGEECRSRWSPYH